MPKNFFIINNYLLLRLLVSFQIISDFWNQILKHTNEILEEEKKILLPKAEYTDQVLQSISTYTFTQIAKQLNIASAQALCKRLVALEVLYYQSGGYLPHSKYSTQGYWGTRTHAITDENGNIVRTTNPLS